VRDYAATSKRSAPLDTAPFSNATAVESTAGRCTTGCAAECTAYETCHTRG